jgi:hypothetical protein
MRVNRRRCDDSTARDRKREPSTGSGHQGQHSRINDQVIASERGKTIPAGPRGASGFASWFSGLWRPSNQAGRARDFVR